MGRSSHKSHIDERTTEGCFPEATSTSADEEEVVEEYYDDYCNSGDMDEIFNVCIAISTYNEVDRAVQEWGRMMVQALDPYYSAVKYGVDWIFKWTIEGHEPCISLVRGLLNACLDDHQHSLKGQLRRRCRKALWLLLRVQNNARVNVRVPPKQLQGRPQRKVMSVKTAKTREKRAPVEEERWDD
jgi:hypothetical protein